MPLASGTSTRVALHEVMFWKHWITPYHAAHRRRCFEATRSLKLCHRDAGGNGCRRRRTVSIFFKRSYSIFQKVLQKDQSKLKRTTAWSIATLWSPWGKLKLVRTKRNLVIKFNLSTKGMKFARKKRINKMEQHKALQHNPIFEIYSSF